MREPQRTSDELKSSLYRCTALLAEIEEAKRNAVREYNDRIADLKMEIAGLVAQLDALGEV